MALLNFNANDIALGDNFEAIPAGDYDAIVTDSEMRQTKDGLGQYLSLTLEIQSGQFQGRKLFDRLNLQNRNPKAVEIAQRQLAQLCHATGIMQVQDSQQLHNRPLVVKVSVKHEPGYDPRNEVKGYKARGAAAQAPAFQAPRAAAPFQPQQPQAQPQEAATPPWATAAA